MDRIGAPTAAANNMLCAGSRTCGVDEERRLVGVRAEPVRAVLVSISTNVVERERIGFELAHRMRATIGISAMPHELIARLFVIAPKIASGCAPAAGILPFGFSRQPVDRAFFFAKPVAEGCGVVPANIYHRDFVHAITTHIAP